jgi:hypothetical protein
MADITAEALNIAAPARRVPTSVLLEQLKHDVPETRVTLGWLLDYLRARSPEVLILFLALVGVLPGVSLAVGILLALLAFATLSANTYRALPAFIASQRLPSQHLVHAIEWTVPLFQWGERFIRPRDALLAERLRPIAWLAILMLSLTMLVPLPLANVIPSLAIGLIAFASIEADGLLLSVSIGAALVSLVISAATIWATLGAAEWVWR